MMDELMTTTQRKSKEGSYFFSKRKKIIGQAGYGEAREVKNDI